MADAYLTMYMPGILEHSSLCLVTVEYISSIEGIHGDTPERFRRKETVPSYEVPFLERMQGKAFRELLKRAQQVLSASKIGHLEKEFLLEVTKTGKTILAIAREDFDLEVIPICITSGNVPHYTEDGRYHVPRADLLAAIVDAYQSGQVKVSKKLKLSSVLDGQLSNMRIEPGAANSDNVEEDLLMALAISLWRAREEHSREIVYADRLNWEKDNRDRADWDPLYGED